MFKIKRNYSIGRYHYSFYKKIYRWKPSRIRYVTFVNKIANIP